MVPDKHAEGVWRYCIEVPREELVLALRSGNTRHLFVELKEVCDRHRKEAAESRERQMIQMRREEINWRNALWEEERALAAPYFPYADNQRCAIEFVYRRFHVPPRCAITFGWVEAYLIMHGYVEQHEGTLDFAGKAPYGRIAVHFSERYSREDYARDFDKAKANNLSDVVLPYDDLFAFRDRIVACVDYLVKHIEEGGIVLTFRFPYVVFKPGQKAYVWHRTAVSVWNLPETTQEFLEHVDIYSNRL